MNRQVKPTMIATKDKEMIELQAKYLKAMLVSTPSFDVRYYLCGINFRTLNGQVVAYATDGHRISKWLITEEYEGKDFNVIVSKDAIKYALASKDEVVTLKPNGNIVTSKGVAKGLVDSKFPDAERVINLDAIKDVTGDCFMNTKYLSDVIKIANLIVDKNKPCKFHQVNSSPNTTVIFTFEGVDNFIHGVMPLRWKVDHQDEQETLDKILN